MIFFSFTRYSANIWSPWWLAHASILKFWCSSRVRLLLLQLLQVLKYLDSRCLVHKEAINFCQNILRKKFVDWEAVYRFNLCRPIRDVDLVVTIGGDGTLLQASHFMDDSVPVLGVNSDPTQAEEVSSFCNCLWFVSINFFRIHIQVHLWWLLLRVAKSLLMWFRLKNTMKNLTLQGVQDIFVQQLSRTLKKWDFVTYYLSFPINILMTMYDCSWLV